MKLTLGEGWHGSTFTHFLTICAPVPQNISTTSGYSRVWARKEGAWALMAALPVAHFVMLGKYPSLSRLSGGEGWPKDPQRPSRVCCLSSSPTKNILSVRTCGEGRTAACFPGSPRGRGCTEGYTHFLLLSLSIKGPGAWGSQSTLESNRLEAKRPGGDSYLSDLPQIMGIMVTGLLRDLHEMREEVKVSRSECFFSGRPRSSSKGLLLANLRQCGHQHKEW